ncbi:MerR family transcriptional regulator [Spongisporangium articulatum]|uniref:MerR family transcriptional regulator n=1 Tax=Spongisporangium articulatum TaxID=3362603 RepID=A0ABW8AUE5_9ACTN
MSPARGEGARASGPASMNIGAVLALLRPDFPDISISKIRFLEDQGLVEPERTASGYRKFSPADVDRLRYVLGVQRDHYLPLRVIRDHLERLDQGLEPPVTRGGPRAPRLVSSSEQHEPEPPQERRLSRAQLLASAQIDEALLADLESHGLVSPRTGTPGTPSAGYDEDAVLIAATARQLADFGIGARHLRSFRSAADREAGLVEQVVNPVRHQRNPESAARAEELGRELTALCLRLHAVLVKTALDRAGH